MRPCLEGGDDTDDRSWMKQQQEDGQQQLRLQEHEEGEEKGYTISSLFFMLQSETLCSSSYNQK